MNWQPIKTAPQDWSDIILYDPNEYPKVFVGYYSCEDGGQNRWLSTRNDPVRPTHWQPLPEPPTPHQP